MTDDQKKATEKKADGQALIAERHADLDRSCVHEWVDASTMTTSAINASAYTVFFCRHCLDPQVHHHRRLPGWNDKG